MSRTFRTALAGAAAGLALALAATAPAASAPKVAGKKVTKLKKGVPYRFQIRDRSPIHDFHLMGPGVNRVLTGVDFTGTKSVVLKLRKGTYRFICDPHASFMHGSFRVA
jgi:plastocyanin